MNQLLDKNLLVGTCKRLPLEVDADRLYREIISIPSELWGEVRATVHQDVEALFVKGYPPIDRKPDDERKILSQLPYFREVIYDLIPGLPAKCVIAKLKPDGYVRMHRDGWVEDPSTEDTYFYDYFYSTVRIHIPIITSEQASFFCNGEFFHMRAGEVWAVNNISDHAVVKTNLSMERTHIILDKHPAPELLSMIENTEPAKGWKDRETVSWLMQDSGSPPTSPYATGKPVPV